MNIKMDKLEELLSLLKKKEDEKQKNTVLWVLAIIGAVAAVAGIAFAVYRFFESMEKSCSTNFLASDVFPSRNKSQAVSILETIYFPLSTINNLHKIKSLNKNILNPTFTDLIH